MMIEAIISIKDPTVSRSTPGFAVVLPSVELDRHCYLYPVWLLAYRLHQRPCTVPTHHPAQQLLDCWLLLQLL